MFLLTIRIIKGMIIIGGGVPDAPIISSQYADERDARPYNIA